MATGAPIKYIPATTQPIIYSVGEDGTDSGGNENSQTSRPATSRWNMLDAVLHLTRQPRPPVQETEPLSGVDAENIVPATTQTTTSPSTEPPLTR
jgi:hypothetical protein